MTRRARVDTGLAKRAVTVATERDAEALTRLINEAFAVERFFVEGDRISVDALRALLRTGVFLTVRDDQSLLACVYVEPRKSRAYLGLLSVDPGHQNQGLGRQLVEAAERWAASAGCSDMDLRVVNLRPELLQFYRVLGYEELSIAPVPSDAKFTRPCHFIKMSKQLSAPEEGN